MSSGVKEQTRELVGANYETEPTEQSNQRKTFRKRKQPEDLLKNYNKLPVTLEKAVKKQIAQRVGVQHSVTGYFCVTVCEKLFCHTENI